MKIAAITDDGKTISQHFGRAAYYQVVTVEDGKVISSELRPKLGHQQFTNEPNTEHDDHADSQQGHGLSPASHDKHVRMSAAIEDCEALLCRGMGMGAYQSMQQRGIRPVVTDIAEIEAAVQAYIRGEIVDRVDRLH
jgi:predicted Fe-Mo cluster-binding NifX family protein